MRYSTLNAIDAGSSRIIHSQRVRLGMRGQTGRYYTVKARQDVTYSWLHCLTRLLHIGQMLLLSFRSSMIGRTPASKFRRRARRFEWISTWRSRGVDRWACPPKQCSPGLGDRSLLTSVNAAVNPHAITLWSRPFPYSRYFCTATRGRIL